MSRVIRLVGIPDIDTEPYSEVLTAAAGDGAAITAASRTSAIPSANLYMLPPNFFDVVGKQLLITASGRISCAVTTPGTARWDVNFLDSLAANAIVADSQAINLNVVAKTNVGWWLQMLLTCRAVGASASLMMQGFWQSEAVVGSPLPTVGGNGSVMIPYNTAPAVGATFDSTLAQVVDLRFTQTVATGSMTLHQYSLTRRN